MTPEQLQAWRWEREIDERNRPLSDEELDAMFPEGYKVITTWIWFLECGFEGEGCSMRLTGYQFPNHSGAEDWSLAPAVKVTSDKWQSDWTIRELPGFCFKYSLKILTGQVCIGLAQIYYFVSFFRYFQVCFISTLDHGYFTWCLTRSCVFSSWIASEHKECSCFTIATWSIKFCRYLWLKDLLMV